MSIEWLLLGFPDDIKFLEHLVQSYKKNYSFDVMMIGEEDEQSMISLHKSEYFHFNEEQRGEEINPVEKFLNFD